MIYTLTLNPALDRELTVPNLAHNTVLRALSTRNDVGGKGFNVSRQVAALGGESVALGYAGGGTGEFLQTHLKAAGIATDFVWVTQETRTNTSIVSDETGEYVKANERGPEISASELDQLMTKVEEHTQAGDYWVLAGSLPPGIPADIYGTLTKIIQAAGAFVILDASGKALEHGIAARPFMIKPNETEAMTLTGADSAEAAAKLLVDSGVETIIISLGENGALLVDAVSMSHFKSPTIIQRNPIGAGDAMVGGIVYALQSGMSRIEALRWGIACGAVAASKHGTTVGSQAEILSMLQQ